eukprot:TRINITY_DN95163_c0_g1_i1.p1 TRINITY_DN95163_c0_g1~~TRINITY_DN95163_c0_g1_i1.p1  ORF type:complete len:363 (+),score=6.61 TRINITY_DN95163_c0_g1_i1:2-1090(+)
MDPLRVCTKRRGQLLLFPDLLSAVFEYLTHITLLKCRLVAWGWNKATLAGSPTLSGWLVAKRSLRRVGFPQTPVVMVLQTGGPHVVHGTWRNTAVLLSTGPCKHSLTFIHEGDSVSLFHRCVYVFQRYISTSAACSLWDWAHTIATQSALNTAGTTSANHQRKKKSRKHKKVRDGTEESPMSACGERQGKERERAQLSKMILTDFSGGAYALQFSLAPVSKLIRTNALASCKTLTEQTAAHSIQLVQRETPIRLPSTQEEITLQKIECWSVWKPTDIDWENRFLPDWVQKEKQGLAGVAIRKELAQEPDLRNTVTSALRWVCDPQRPRVGPDIPCGIDVAIAKCHPRLPKCDAGLITACTVM